MLTNTLLIALALLPIGEQEMARKVADEYGLSTEQVVLLCAIRKVENGGPGLEFGIGQDYSTHRARRSTLAQYRWAAGTIKKRYSPASPGSYAGRCAALRALAQRWCPKNWESWYRNVNYWIVRNYT